MEKLTDPFTFSIHEVFGDLARHEAKYAPEVLYGRGDLSLLSAPGQRISVVGSRAADQDALRRARVLTNELVSAGVVVVSGLARGVDTVAHQTAIDAGGRTMAVLGTPLDKVSPVENRPLFEEICRHHLAISQFASATRTHPGHFPQRNRTMALFSDATIIVAAEEKSGTEHQAWEAIRLGRQVFVLESVTSRKIAWIDAIRDYGAEVLNRSNLATVLDDLPLLSSRAAFSTAI